MRTGTRESQKRWLRLTAVAAGSAWLLAAPASFAQPSSSAATSDSGQQIFNNKCRTCHSVKEGDNRLGPNLYKVIGRKAGSLANYNYSPSMRGADFVWDQDKLARFLVKPDDVVSGNKMQPYGGISPEDAAKVIAYLQSVAGAQ